MVLSNQLDKKEDFQAKDLWGSLLSKGKKYLFKRNYALTSNSNFNYLYATILNTIKFLQVYVLLSLPIYNQAVAQDNGINFLVDKGIFLLCKVNVQTELNINRLLVIGLCGIQILLLLLYLMPVEGKEANLSISKYLIHVLSTITYIPSIFICTGNLINAQSIYLSLLTITLTLINRLLFTTLHFQYSIQGQNHNILIRNPLSTPKEIVSFFLLIIFLLCKYFMHPMSLIIYFIINIVFCLFSVKEYCIGFNYHNQFMAKLMGILSIMKISILLCYLIVLATEIALVKNNIATFIVAFFLFFANFFLIFKKHSTKSIVIDLENHTQTKKIIFIMWYLNCFRNRAQKKNQLYLSSLLKNHSSSCAQLYCCCKRRQQIYDPSTNTFGSPSSQPHQDIVYIKHFFLKLLSQTAKEFPKSNEILFLLAFYHLQVLNFIPQTIELIKELKKRSLSKNLILSEEYVLYCLGQRCYTKINEINNEKGNLNLEKVRSFDLKISQLKDTIKFSVNTFSRLWKTICFQNYKQKSLVEICKVALQTMFKIEQNYKQIKSINNVSTELKGLMIFYSKSVAHDIHFQSEIRKEIKLNAENNLLSNLTEVKQINIFSPDTITLITSEVSHIRWASKNCFTIFGYDSREEFLKLKINDLMPKFFSENHDSFIKKWLETGHSTKLNNCNYLWGSTKDGFCFSLALYIKIIPLQKQQDFAFFAAIQKIDIESEIICNQQGEILGCGKFFASIIKCSPKSIQDYKPNIQILIPSSFELFLQHFYPENKTPRQSLIEVRREGYFPKNLQTVLKHFFKDKEIFLSKNSGKSNFNELYCNFLKQKMQQVTVNIDGKYISLISTVHQVSVFENKKKKIIIFKLTGFKKHNIEKYYDDLENMIAKIQKLKIDNKEQRRKKSLKYQSIKSLKRDYFKVFMNPKKIKRKLQQQSAERQNEEIDSQNKLNAISMTQRQQIDEQQLLIKDDQVKSDDQKMIKYRKRLALGAQSQIKSERAKYNVWKMKKALFEEGVFTRYTYNMLLGKGTDFESIQHISKSEQKTDDPSGKILGNQYENDSEDELTSNNAPNKGNAENQDNPPNDKETFNSATSSAAFISMTNSIKMFKIKLRSLNTPKLLYWLNVGLIVVICLLAGFKIWLWIEEVSKTELGQLYFSKGTQSAWVIDSMLMGKLMTQKLTHLQQFSTSLGVDQYNSTQSKFQKIRDVNINRMQQILSVHLHDLAYLESKDLGILKYLSLQIPLIQTIVNGLQTKYLTGLQFLMREQDFSRAGYNIVNSIQMDAFLQEYQALYKTNIYYQTLSFIDQSLFIGAVVALVLALMVSIPIVYKIESKVKQIMQLISKISINQRRRYFLKFSSLNEELKKLTESQGWADLQANQQVPLKIANPKINRSELLIEQNLQHTSLLSKPIEQQQKTSLYSKIYFKIVIIYVVYLAIYCGKFIYIQVIFNEFMSENDIYSEILIEKVLMTQNSLLFNQLITRNNTADVLIHQSQFVQRIYQSYHLSQGDNSNYANLLMNVTTNDVCLIINTYLQTVTDENAFLEGFQLSSQQLQQCQQLNNRSLSKGLFSSLDYIEQKRLEINNSSIQNRITYLSSQTSFNLEKMLYYTNTMSYIIESELRIQVENKKEKLVFQMGICIIIVGIALMLFTIAWVIIYLNIAERASYINAFLLLIPYEVLSQNPYIKLYIKNEFDYKASVY